MKRLSLALVVFAMLAVGGARPLKADALWDLRVLETPPGTEPVASHSTKRMRAIFFEGPPWRGKLTKVFAYVGLPEGASADATAPGVVCVHGGGGTAFAEWVEIWNKRGFAAIAIDTGGNIPATDPKANPNKTRHPWAGPTPYGFEQADQDPHDQWPYHAVSAIMRANSLLRSLPEVDSSNVGVTGISWGGYLTSLVAGVDPRFKFAVPVYGCGYLHEGSTWEPDIRKYGRERWVHLWDPSSHLRNAKCPMLWLNGTNDKHYHLPAFQKTYRLPSGPRQLTVRVRMAHSHSAGWTPPEIFAFAEAVVGRGAALVQVGAIERRGDQLSVQYQAPDGVVLRSAVLNYTTDNGLWENRRWQTQIARVQLDESRIVAALAPQSTACYFNLVDDRGLISSSEHIEPKK